MDWKDLAGPVIRLGGTVIGTMLGSPTLGATGGKILADALGVPATPDAVAKEVMVESVSPDVLAAVRQADAEAEKEWARTAATQSREVNKTIRAELATVSWWHWRHLLGYVVVLWAVAILPPTVKDLWTSNATGITLGIQLAAALAPFFFALCGLLGWIARDTSRRSIAAAQGSDIPSAVSELVKLLGRK